MTLCACTHLQSMYASIGVKQVAEEGRSMNAALLDTTFDAETFRYALVLDDCLHIVMK